VSRQSSTHARTPELPGYEVLERIGKGGMGEVYAAVRVGPAGFRKELAIKRLRMERNPSDEAVQRFLREARVSAALDHPNIVHVHDLLDHGGDFFMVMERLRGLDLRQALKVQLKQEPRFPPLHVVVAIAHQVLQGLAHAHLLESEDGRPLGLVHRDLTPRNVFVCRTGIAKILDFGVARLRFASPERVLTRDGQMLGTLPYLAPEVQLGQQPDARSDLYQVGVMLYMMLTGERPLVKRDGVRAPKLGDIDERIRGVVSRALTMDPRDRYQDAEGMGEALREIVPARLTRRKEIARWLAALEGRERGDELAPPEPLATAGPTAEPEPEEAAAPPVPIEAVLTDLDASGKAKVGPSTRPPPPLEPAAGLASDSLFGDAADDEVPTRVAPELAEQEAREPELSDDPFDEPLTSSDIRPRTPTGRTPPANDFSDEPTVAGNLFDQEPTRAVDLPDLSSGPDEDPTLAVAQPDIDVDLDEKPETLRPPARKPRPRKASGPARASFRPPPRDAADPAPPTATTTPRSRSDQTPQGLDGSGARVRPQQPEDAPPEDAPQVGAQAGAQAATQPEDAQQSPPEPSAEPPPAGEPSPEAPRSKWPLAAGAAIFAVSVGAGVALFTGGSTEEDAPQPAPTVQAAASPAVISVAPFHVVGDDPAVDALRAGASRTVEVRLRAASFGVLGPSRIAAGEDTELLRSVRDLGAHRLITGRVAPAPEAENVLVQLTLWDVASATEESQEERAAPVATLADTLREMVGSLLGLADDVVDLPGADAERALYEGLAARERYEFPDAEAHFARALELSPRFSDAAYQRVIAAWWAAKPKEEVLTHLDASLALEPPPERVAFLEALRAFVEGDLQDAIVRFGDATERFPDVADLRYGLFEAQFHGGQAEQAMNTYREIVRLAPQHQLGITHVLDWSATHGDEAGLQWALERVLERAPHRVWRVRAALAARDYDEAIARADALLADAADSEIAEERIIALALRGDLDEAEAAIDAVSSRRRTIVAWGLAAADSSPRRASLREEVLSQLAGTDAGPERTNLLMEVVAMDLASESGDDLDETVILFEAGLRPDDHQRIPVRALELLAWRATGGDREAPDVVGGHPQLEAIRAAIEAERGEDWAAAVGSWQLAADHDAAGRLAVLLHHLEARAAREAEDADALRAACAEVERPLRFRWSWATAVRSCRAWTRTRRRQATMERGMQAMRESVSETDEATP